MNFAGNFVTIGEVDPGQLHELVLQISEDDWNSDVFRQRRYETHRDTQTVGLVFDPDFRHSHPTRLPMLQKFEPALRPVLKMLADHFEQSENGRKLTEQFGLGYFIRATLVRLKAGGLITPHTDNNFSLVHSHRLHVPIISNEKVSFTVGDETITMRSGDVIEINNRRTHSVNNGGSEDRIHLILDFVIPGEKCCCGAKRHPDLLCSPQACRETDHLEIPCTCFPES
ncbi:MAG: aspartyl/asparaginyl beta-hydroxylase domain-containing protein [Woeseiaceae bacterium]